MSLLPSYRVQSGDTLTEIARQHGASAEALMRANGMDPALADGQGGRAGIGGRDPDLLQVGERLLIPVATPGLERNHRVAAGETLSSIAERWSVSMRELLAANPQFDASRLGAQRGSGAGRDPDLLQIGELLRLPGAHPAAASQPASAQAGAAASSPTAAAPARLDLRHFTDPALGSRAGAAIVIGSAEGTRRPDGGETPAFAGHTDPGNAARNQGSFSYQHAAHDPSDADRRQLQALQRQLPAYENAARQAGLDPANPRLASAYLDLYNQSPSAARRFLAQLDSLHGQPLDAQHLARLRFHSFVDAATGQRFQLPSGGQAGSGYVQVARQQLHRTPSEAQVQATLLNDQMRRTQAMETALVRQGLLALAPSPGQAQAPAAVASPAPAGPGGVPRHLAIAQGELGVHEIRGAQHERRVVQYHQATSLRARDDETSWCSSFVNWTMQQAGVRGTGSAAARSWLQWGRAVPADARHVRPGDVIVFPRGSNPAQGHVAIVSDVLGDGRVRVIGGNQAVRGQGHDGVTYSERSLASALGVRRAP